MINYSKYLMAIMFLLLQYSCDSKNIRNSQASINGDSLLELIGEEGAKLSDSLFHIEKEISYQNYLMKVVTTCQSNSVDTEEKYLFRPIVISQNFIFYINNQYIDSLSIPIRTIEQKVDTGKIKKMLDCVFFKAEIIRRTNQDIIYHVIGYGGCNGDCPSCEVIFSSDGNLIALDYRTDTEIISKKGIPEYLDEIVNGKPNGDILKELIFYP